MLRLVKDFFYFSRSERRGIIFLFCLVVILLCTSWILPHLFAVPNDGEWTAIVFDKSELKDNDLEDKADKIDGSITFCDPDTLSEESWKNLGFSHKQVKVILSFKEKNGGFHEIKDLEKIFVISAEKLEKLRPFFVFNCRPTSDNSLSQSQHDFQNSKRRNTVELEKDRGLNLRHSEKKIISLNLNTANSDELIELKGIGAYFAEKIIKFRNALGGFHDVQQLYEVYKLDSTVVNAIKPFVFIAGETNKIDLNSSDINELKKHPYIDYNLAKALVNYRKVHGNFGSVTEIRSLDLVNDELYRKIAPYLEIQ